MITVDEVREAYHYDPETGEFTWKIRSAKRIKIGDKAASERPNAKRNQGYLCTSYKGKSYTLHRLAWFYVYGEWPDLIDHIDRDRHNNRISNLRKATYSENTMNSGIYKSNTSGHRGVTLRKQKGRKPVWVALITVDGKKLYLGCSQDKSKAISLRQEAERKFFPVLQHDPVGQ